MKNEHQDKIYLQFSYVKLLMKLWAKNETPNQLSKSSQEMNLRIKEYASFAFQYLHLFYQFFLTAISILAVQGIGSFVAVIVIFDRGKRQRAVLGIGFFNVLSFR